MSENKKLFSSLLVAVIVGAIALSVAGCAKQSNGAQTGNPPTVTTDNGQPSSGPNQQQAQTNGQPSTQNQSQAQNSGQPDRHFNPQQMQTNMQKALSGLVSKGTISQDQADKVVQLFANYKRGQGQNPLDGLVANGTLTQAQANAVRQAMPHPQGARMGSSSSGQTTPQ